MNKEYWKPIVEYENYYEISNMGRVKRIQTGLILHPRISSGYCLVDLRAKRKRKYHRIHRLVAFAFIGTQPTLKHEIRHICVDNLIWGTRKDNEHDKIRHNKTNRGQRNGRSKLTLEQVIQIKQLLLQGDLLQRQIANIFSVTRMTISDIKCKKSWNK